MWFVGQIDKAEEEQEDEAAWELKLNHKARRMKSMKAWNASQGMSIKDCCCGPCSRDEAKDEMKQVDAVTRGVEAKCQMAFHVTDSRRILVAVSKVVEADNTVVFSKWGSYVENNVTGERMKIDKKRGVYLVKANVWNGDGYVAEEIVIDSGAADNVMPKEALKREKMLGKQAVKFQGANGAELGNYGRKIISFIPAEWGFQGRAV